MKKLHILFLVLLAFATIMLVSCNALYGNHKTDGNFSISFSGQNARIAIEDTDLVTYTIKLESTDGKSYSQTQSDTLTAGALRNAEFSFTDIPLKIELVISAQFETEEGVFFGGNSEPFTLTSADTKQITVELQKLLSTPYLLLSYPYNQGRYFVLEQFDSLDDDPTISIGRQEGNDQILSYCYDSDETLWFCNYNGQSYSYTLNYCLKEETTSQPCTDGRDSFADIDYDSSTDTLYLLHIKDNNNWSDSDSSINLIKPAALKAGTEPERYGLPAFDSSTKIQGGAAGEGSYYIYGYSEVETLDGPDKIVPWIAKAIPGTGSFTLGPKTELTDASLGLEPDGVYLDTFDTFEISDLTVQDGKVFALFKQVATDDYSLQLIQRGGLLVFEKKNDGTLVHKKTLGLAPMVSMTLNTEVWIDDDGLKPVYTDRNPSETQLMQELPALLGLPYREDIDKYFCLPQKFVATKPKKLVFADHGAFIYIDEEGKLQTSTKNDAGQILSDAPSRIIEVNLEDFSFSATELGRMFNDLGDACGYQLIQREPEERALEETLYKDDGTPFTVGSAYYFSYVYPTLFKYHK